MSEFGQFVRRMFHDDYSTPLVAISREIQEAVERKNYYVALIAGLSLIDMCAALESEDGEANKDKFAQWFDTNMIDYVPKDGTERAKKLSLSGKECYTFRNKLLHQGRAALLDDKAPRSHKTGVIAFSIGSASFHRSNLEGNYYVDIPNFLGDICRAVSNWRVRMTGNSSFERNHARMLQYGTEVPGGANRPGHYLF